MQRKNKSFLYFDSKKRNGYVKKAFLWFLAVISLFSVSGQFATPALSIFYKSVGGWLLKDWIIFSGAVWILYGNRQGEFE